MSPEQRLRATASRKHGGPLPAVDERSDIYSLGLVLYEALAGGLPLKKESRGLSSAEATSVTEDEGKNSLPLLQPLRQHNPRVPVGLADIIHKCLAADPTERYRNAAALATDLRRHLSDLPLLGVKNRSLAERWRKWRRRKPHALALAGMFLAMLVTTVGVVGYTFTHVNQRLRDAKTALGEGQEQMRSRAYEEAARTFRRGLALSDGIPGSAELVEKLRGQLQLARRGQAADRLHLLANHIRLLYADDSRSSQEARSLEDQCQKVWDARLLMEQHGQAGLDATVEEQIRTDLLDLAILWVDLRYRWARGDQINQACRDALRILTQAEELLGPSVILAQERQAYAERLGRASLGDAGAHRIMTLVPRTAWEHFCLGRSLLGGGNLAQAVAEFDQALLLNPQDFWASFYRGQCAYRLQHYADAVNAFGVCLALLPTSAHCFYNRALARTALGDTEKALLDYDRSLELDPNLGPAALNRGILHYNAKNYTAAIADLRRALKIGTDTARVYYNLGLVYHANGQKSEAVACLEEALKQGGAPPEAGALLNQLRHKR
jgi:tetratricopeptide (TPR) repeat protein